MGASGLRRRDPGGRLHTHTVVVLNDRSLHTMHTVLDSLSNRMHNMHITCVVNMHTVRIPTLYTVVVTSMHTRGCILLGAAGEYF